jgi:hypothetical protein
MQDIALLSSFAWEKSNVTQNRREKLLFSKKSKTAQNQSFRRNGFNLTNILKQAAYSSIQKLYMQLFCTYFSSMHFLAKKRKIGRKKVRLNCW